jgi:Flp pilus assembly pilin Flp
VVVQADGNLTMLRPGSYLDEPDPPPPYTPSSICRSFWHRPGILKIVTSHVLKLDVFATDVEPMDQDSPTAERVTRPMSVWTQLVLQEDGVTSVEYAVMLAMILLTCLGTIAALGGNAGGTWQDNSTRLESAMGGP